MATVSKPRLKVGKMMSGRFGKERATTCSGHEKGFIKKSHYSALQRTASESNSCNKQTNATTMTERTLFRIVTFATWLTWKMPNARVTTTMIALMFFSWFLNLPTSPFGGVFVLNRTTITQMIMVPQVSTRHNIVLRFLSTRFASAEVK